MIIASIGISLASIALNVWTLRTQRRTARSLRRIATLAEPPALEAS